MTSYILLRRLAAANPDADRDTLTTFTYDHISDDKLARIGHGYLKYMTGLPDGLRHVFETAGKQVFKGHQRFFTEDSAFPNWALRPDYLDIDTCYSHPDFAAAPI